MSKAISIILYMAFTVISLYSTAIYASIFDDDAKAIVMGGVRFVYKLFDMWFWFLT